MNTVSLEDNNKSVETSFENIEPDAKNETHIESDLQTETQAEVSPDEQVEEHEEQEALIEEDEPVDYTNLTVAELSKIAKSLLKLDDIPEMLREFSRVDQVVREKEHQEEAEDKKLYIQKLGTSAGFEYKPSNEIKSYYKIYETYKSIKNEYQRAIDKRQKEALKRKNELLKEINDLIDFNFKYNKIKQLLKEWKAITDIPLSEHRKQYDIYREITQKFHFQNQVNLKFLRLQEDKNLERKKSICKKAEALIEHEDPHKAYKAFQEILEEFKAVGPVPLKNKDEIWERLRAIRNQIRKKRNDAVKKHRETLQSNLVLKEKICEQLKVFSNFDSENLKDWYKATDQIKQIQKEWYAVGHIPKESIETMRQKYHEYLDGFYGRKQQFFKNVDEIKKKNLELKTKIYNQIQAVKNTKDLKKGGEKIIELQKDWYKIGAVPDKEQAIEEKFRTVCDTFFNNRREYYKERNNTIKLTLKAKQEIIDNLDNLDLNEQNFESYINEAVSKFIKDSEGLPVKSTKELIRKFVTKIEQLATKFNLDRLKKKQIVFTNRVIMFTRIPTLNLSAVRERNKLFKQISALVYEAELLENNLSFFKTSNSKKGLNRDIIKFRNKLENIKQQLKDKEVKLSIYKRYLKN